MAASSRSGVFVPRAVNLHVLLLLFCVFTFLPAELAKRCWDKSPEVRPTFKGIVEEIERVINLRSIPVLKSPGK